MGAEDFFPLGWLDRPFRRQPYPDKTYEEALDAAIYLSWAINTDDGKAVYRLLVQVEVRMQLENKDFPGRSRQNVSEFSGLWLGKVITLLKTSEGTK